MTNELPMSPVGITNYASQQNDRWLFLFVLVLIALALVCISKWLVKQYEAFQVDAKVSRESYHESLLKVVREQAAANAQITEVVRNCSTVMEGCVEEMRLCRQQRGERTD